VQKIETDIPRDLLKDIEPWAKPLLEGLGELEWGKYGFVLKSDQTELGDEIGWVIRKSAADNHYQVGIGLFQAAEETTFRFFIKTGGETVVSRGLTSEALKEALSEAINNGPTHLPPPRKVSRKR
jgi:hypothetical protein